MRRITVLIVLMGLSPVLNAQIKFRGSPAPECQSFFIVEGGAFYETGDREFGANSDIGVMFNLSRRSALGGSIFHQLAADVSGVGVKLRYRYWLNSSFSLDIAPGILLLGEWAPAITGQVSLNYKDLIGVFVQIDSQHSPYIRRMPFSLGVKFGRYLGIVPSALVVLVTLLYGYKY